MRTLAVRGVGFSALVLACCVRSGPPAVAPSATIGVGGGASGPRGEAAFSIVASGPRGDVGTDRENIVSVLFNRPMRTLADADDATSFGATIRAKDGRVPEGHWLWIGTRGLVFEPTVPLAASSEYDVVVPATARALDGATLGMEQRFSFAIAPPHVASLAQAGHRDLRPTAVFRLELDQDVSPEDVAATSHIVAQVAGSPMVRTIAVRGRRPAAPRHSYAEAHLQRLVELVPTEPLPTDAKIDLVIGKGLKGAGGPRTTTKDQSFAMRTFGPLRLDDVRCQKPTMGRCAIGQEVSLALSNAVEPSEFLAHLEVKGGDPARLLVEKSSHAPKTTLPIVRQAKAGKRYHVTVRKGLHDVFGQALDHDIVVDVDVEAPFIGGDVKGPAPKADAPVADAPPPVGVAHRAELTYQAEIGIRGYVVEALADVGIKAHKVPIGTVNVPTIGTYAAPARQEDLTRFFDGSLGASGPRGDGWSWAWRSPGLPESIRSVETVDLDALLGGAGKRGGVLLALTVPGGTDASMTWDRNRTTDFLSVTDLGVTARMSRKGSLIWVTHLSTGLPVGNAVVSMLRPHPGKGEKVEESFGTTDAEGLLTIPSERLDATDAGHWNERWLVVRDGADWTYQHITPGRASSAAWWDVDGSQVDAYRGLLFTERGVYRPGETIKLSGILRRPDGVAETALAGRALHVVMNDGEGNAIAHASANLDEFGSFSIDVAIPKTAMLGGASLRATLPRATGGGVDGEFSTELLLAAYRASAFKIETAFDRTDEDHPYIRGDQAKLLVGGDYLYGAPMSDASVDTTVTRAPVTFTPANADTFIFGDDRSMPARAAAPLQSPKGALDGAGKLEAPIKLVMDGQRQTERVTVETEVEDSTHQTVSKTTSALVHPAEIYLGIDRSTGRFVTVKNAAALSTLQIKPQIAAFEPNGHRRAGVSVTVELVLRSWTNAVEEQSDGSPLTLSAEHEKVVATCTLTTSTTVASCPLSVHEVGAYSLRAHAVDPRGNEVHVGTSLYVLTSEGDAATDSRQAWGRSDLRVVHLEPEKDTYRVGEMARVLVRNPYKRAEALVTIERSGVVSRKRMTLEGSMPVIELPVAQDWFPNVFVTVDLVRGRVGAPPRAGVDLNGPEARVGITELKIDPSTHRLRVAITPSKKELSPGESFSADVAITDADGKPTQASLTFYAVDEGVLMLTGYRTPDPLPPFAQRVRLGVFGFDSRENLASIVPMRGGERVPILGWEVASEGWSKGSSYGGGGDGDGRASVRADFRATAFFEAGRVTGADGHARFDIKLPDNLTSYRLMAVAAARDDRFGFGQDEVKASKSLMIRPALPRQLRVGDVLDAAFVVATKGLTGDVDVALKIAGTAKIEAHGALTARVHVTAGAQPSVRFPITVTGGGDASFEVEAHLGSATDRLLLQRAVEQPMTVTSVASFGETTSPVALKLGEMRGHSTTEGGLVVKLASSALVGLDSSFERLVDYPYGCTEQVASKTLPLLSMVDLAKLAGARLPAKLDDAVNDGIAKLLAHQQASGGFGFWDDDPAVPWLSAYAVMVLEEASKKGYSVPSGARDVAIQYLRSELAATLQHAFDANPSAEGGEEDSGMVAVDARAESSSRRHRGLATATMILDVLATSGAPDPGSIDRVYDVRADLPVFAQALLLHAMAAAKIPQAAQVTLAKEIESRLRIDANEASVAPEGADYAPMLESTVRATALVLRAFVAVDPKNALAPRLARSLLAARADGAWASTQEAVWSLLALDAYRKAQEPAAAAFEGRVYLGDDSILSVRFDGVAEKSIFVAPDKLASGDVVTLDRIGMGTLFYGVELHSASTVLPSASIDRGLFVDKRVRGIAPSDLDEALATMPKARATSGAALAVDHAQIGQLVLIDLIVESAETREQVVIDDPLPSGVEPIDINLATVGGSRAIAEGPFASYQAAAETTKGAPTAAFALHREQRDDRVVTFVGHIAPGLYHFRYLARATATGTFVVPPTTVTAMYSPEIYGATAATLFTIDR